MVENECGDKKTEVKNAEEVTEKDVKEEIQEEVAEEKADKEDDEVIKIEALNSAPTALKDVSGKSDWMSLHGQAFWDYLAKHPEIRG